MIVHYMYFEVHVCCKVYGIENVIIWGRKLERYPHETWSRRKGRCWRRARASGRPSSSAQLPSCGNSRYLWNDTQIVLIQTCMRWKSISNTNETELEFDFGCHEFKQKSKVCVQRVSLNLQKWDSFKPVLIFHLLAIFLEIQGNFGTSFGSTMSCILKTTTSPRPTSSTSSLKR